MGKLVFSFNPSATFSNLPWQISPASFSCAPLGLIHGPSSLAKNQPVTNEWMGGLPRWLAEIPICKNPRPMSE